MAITFTNNWKNILDKLESILKTEFKGAVPVFRGKEIPAGNQFIRLDPVGSTLSEYSVSSEMREFTINIQYVFSGGNLNKRALDTVLRFVSRTEALIHDNITMTLSDSPATEAFNCRFISTDIGASDDESTYIVSWIFMCQHLGNTG